MAKKTREVFLQIRVSAAEKKLLREAAGRDVLPLSMWARRVLLTAARS